MSQTPSRLSSAGGARVAGGVIFQAQVFASWSARAVADRQVGLGLNPAVRIRNRRL